MIMQLNGEEVDIKELNLGDMVDLSVLVIGKTEMQQGLIIVSLLTGKSVDELRALPPKAINDITKIAEYAETAFLEIETK